MKDRTATRLLVVVTILQGLALLSLWTGHGPTLPQAQAQVPDAGGQRIQIIEELRQVNAKLDKMSDLLRGGELQVRVVSTDDRKAGNPR